MQHGGVENGKLPVRFDDFEAYGISEKSVAPAIREVEALGFVRSVHGRSCCPSLIGDIESGVIFYPQCSGVIFYPGDTGTFGVIFYPRSPDFFTPGK